ncbi:MAG: hypothetical protein SOT81_08550 [Treponema sp.]|nr:hypothetical protein [Treponema sp.]
MTFTNLLPAKNRDEFREWLIKNHQSEKDSLFFEIIVASHIKANFSSNSLNLDALSKLLQCF